MKRIQTPFLNRSLAITRGLRADITLDRGYGTPINNVNRRFGTSSGLDWVGSNSKYGYGIDFNASTDYFQYSLQGSEKFSTKMSFEFIMTRESGGSGVAYSRFLSIENDNGDDILAVYNDNGDAGWGVPFFMNWDSQAGIWSIPYPDTAEHHYIVTYDGQSTSNDADIWVDGVRQTVTERLTPSGSLPTIGAHSLIIGNNAEHNQAMDGKHYLVRYWNRILSDKEKIALFNDPLHMYLETDNPVHVHVASPSITANYGGMGLMGI